MTTIEGCDVLAILAETDDRLLARVRVDGSEPVVVKVLKNPDLGPTDLARLQHEFAVAAELSEDAVVRPLRVQTFGRRTGLVLTDTGGTSLAAILEAGPLGVPAAVRLGHSLAHALAQVHHGEVIHRDIKPANVLVDAAGERARLIDFGIASRLPRLRPTAGAPAQLEGSLAYMAPEQTGRMNRSVDHRSDLYALGVTLYQMLTGRLPFPTADPLELVHGHLAVIPPAPRDLDPAVPAAVSAIIMRLLAKSPEDRYQSATGLAHDLRHAGDELRSTGTVAEFPLGGTDVSARFEVPERLYGRSAEAGDLAALVEGVAAAGSALALVSGPAGIGKTALVRELHAPTTAHRGYFVSGKFDQFNRDVPYASLAEAFAGLVRQLLAEPADRVAAWRAALGEALGPNAGVIADVIPELRLVVGDVEPPAPLGPVEAQNRFNLAFAAFVGVFARAGRPLVVFLDDLHWADVASLKLLATLLTAPGLQHVLVVGAYRPAEVSASHPLTLALDGLPPGLVHPVEVSPLGADVVAELVADALGVAPAAVESLADHLHDRTGGNPFFLGQLLRAAAEQGLIRHADTGWRWDLPGIRSAGLADDVVEFMIGRLSGLPASCRRALQAGAVIGNRFGLQLMAAALEEPPAEAAARLWPAIHAGLLLPLSEHHELVSSGLTDADVSYGFLHDRVQQACHATISPERLPELHAQVGALLRERLGDGGDGVFEVVEHLNAAAASPGGTAADLDLALLNLRAGRRAKDSAAYDTAARLLGVARGRLPAGSWETAYEASRSVHLLEGEVLAALGRVEEAEQRFAELLAGARDAVDAASACAARADAMFGAGRILESLGAAKEGLAMLGWAFPAPGPDSARAAAETMGRLADAAATARLGEAAPGDASSVLTGRLFSAAVIAAYFAGSEEFGLIVATAVEQIMAEGRSPYSGMSAVYLAMELARTGQLDHGIRYAEIALSWVTAGDNIVMLGAVQVLAWAYCLGWRYPLAQHEEVMRETFWLCQNGGALLYANYAQVCEGIPRLVSGRDLPDQLALWERAADHGRRYAPQLVGGAEVYADVLRETTGLGRSFDREAAVDAYRVQSPILSGLALITMAWGETYLGDHGSAFAHAQRAHGIFAAVGGVPTGLWVLPYHVAHAVSACRLATEIADHAERDRLLATARSASDSLEPLAPAGGQFAAYRSIALAELRRAEGDRGAAEGHYLRTIDEAAENDFPFLQGWAHELLGRLHAERGRDIARVHLREARALFVRCGAGAKADQLDREFPGLAEAPRHRPFDATGTHSADDAAARDLSAVLRASRAIATEVSLERVAERVVSVAVDISGAESGVFLPAGQTAQPGASALELPIVRNDELAGTLCLTFAGPVDPGRLDLLRLVSPQMAISLENARLYSGLEAQVADRSAQLAATLDALRLMQDQIVQSEKLASLGGLVAGIAHEVSTPIGVAVTAVSHLGGQLAGFESATRGSQLRRSTLEAFLRTTADSGSLILDNLQRAADLVQSFKQVAVDSSNEAERTIDLGAYIRDVVASLRPKLAPTPHAVTVDCPPDLALTTHPGALAQVLTNLLLNSLAHAYGPDHSGTLRIAVTAEPTDVRLRYSDDGRGIPAAALPRVFDPFFTTARAGGGSGLGLHIVHNLVTGQLGGTVTAASVPGEGVSFTITLPRALVPADAPAAAVAR